MAHHVDVEPMDVDSDFDNKENSLHHNNVLPFTEKGYEELDVSELNMKLRYSVTPASSPMSKSYTANCLDNRANESGDDTLNITVSENANLSRSLNSTMTRNDSVVKTLKALPLQAIPSDQYVDNNRNTSVLRPLDSTVTLDNANVTVTVSGTNDSDENLFLPSCSSSALPTPEATTPTTDPNQKDGGSPILRGIKSVLNMFRSSQSPIPPTVNETAKVDPVIPTESETILASTPIAAHRKKEPSPTKRSPPKETSVVFNEDLEKELQWKDESTIIFSHERIPIHKLLFQHPQVNRIMNELPKQDMQDLNSSVEYMDISFNDSVNNKTITDVKKLDGTIGGESDGEFVDCETTFTKNESQIEDNAPIADQTQNLTVNEVENKNESGSRLKPIILDTTQDILDATLSVRPEDLLPQEVNETKDISTLVFDQTKTVISKENHDIGSITQVIQPMFDQTVNLSNPVALEDPNATKTIGVDVIPTAQPIDQTFDMNVANIENKNLNITKNIENNMNITQELNNTNNINEILSSTITKGNENKTFGTIEQIDQGMNVTNILENKLDATQILEHKNEIGIQNTTVSMENKTFDVNDTLINEINQAMNVTKTIEKNLDATQILDPKNENDIQNATVTLENKTFDVNNPDINEMNQGINVTKTIQNNLDTTQVLDHSIQNTTVSFENKTFNVNDPTSDKIGQVMDITKTIENNLDATQILDHNETDKQNTTMAQENKTFEIIDQVLDVTKTIQNNLDSTQTQDQNESGIQHKTVLMENKTFDIQDNAIQDELIHNTDLNKSEVILTKGTPEVPIETASEPLDVTITGAVPDHHNMDTNKQATTELPVDIPLPDEDDLEKEFNTDIPEYSLPLDLVDDIKIMPELETIHNIPVETAEIKTKNISENIPTVINNVSLALEDDKIDNIKTSEINLVQEIKGEIIESIKMENEMYETDIIEIAKTIDNETKIESVKESPNETNLIENNDLNKTVETMASNVIKNQDVVPMDINDSFCGFKPLPDIINQAVARPTSEEIEPVALNEALGEPLEERPENMVKTDHEVISENIIKTEEEVVMACKEIKNIESIKETSEIEKDLASTIVDSVTYTDINPADVSMAEALPESAPIDLNKEHNVSKDIQRCDAKADLEVKAQVPENTDSTKVEEEIVVSENNSPFVSVSAEDIPETKPDGNDIESVEDPLVSKSKIVITPPSSPPIRSKGYNFNFDDVDLDPFATKTKIRISPSLDSPNQLNEPNLETHRFDEKPLPKKDINRRKSQPERKRPIASKRKFNSTFDGKVNEAAVEKPVEKIETVTVGDMQLNTPTPVALSPNNVTIEEKDIINKEINVLLEKAHQFSITESETVIPEKLEEPTESSTEVCKSNEEIIITEGKASSSSEQSTYLSATSSNESSLPARNVFNLPEIDDVNFNPFATKSKMRQSPPPSLNIENPFANNDKTKNSPNSSLVIPPKEDTNEHKIETELMEKDSSENLSNTTVSSKATDDKNITAREIHTEDEDTIEGPFLEAEDLDSEDKMSGIEGDHNDMMHFNELPVQNNEENLDTGELFIDAEAFEFLLNQNKANTVVDSGKESLFLKFDPLFAKRMSAVTSDGVVASLANLQKRQSTPTKAAPRPSLKNMPSPIAGPSNVNITQDEMNVSDEFNDDLNVTVSKPMMVVPPAVNPVTPRNKSLTPNRSNRRSFTFTSPAMAVIDRLLSLSGNSSMVHDTTVTQVTREQNEADIALSQLRELLAEKEINVYQLRSESNELRDRLNTLEGHVKNLEAESQDRLKKINMLTDTLAEKTKINRNMAAVVEEYERTIASLIAEIAQDKKKHDEERKQLINERDEQTAHLASMEVSFSDLHSKYEKSKQVILNCKANEETYKKSIKEFEENLIKMQNNYESLKQHATSKLNHANQELEKMNRTHEAEVLKLNAMIKRKDLHITSLEESLAQKTKANEELTAICDELINKVG